MKIWIMKIDEIFQIINFWNYLKWKINKLLECFQFVKQKFDKKKWAIVQLFVYSIFRPTRNFATLICALWYKTIFSIFIFHQQTHNFVRSTFERSLMNFKIRSISHSKILPFEISTLTQNFISFKPPAKISTWRNIIQRWPYFGSHNRIRSATYVK